MQLSLPIHSIHGKAGAQNYLDASDLYFSDYLLGIRSVFPDIKAKCPVCSASGCAWWKGYYHRRFYCSKLEFNGKVAIRKGFCRNRNIHFSYLPDFMIPKVWWSIFFLLEIVKNAVSESSFFRSCPLQCPFSTFYWIGQFIVKAIRLNSTLFPSNPSSHNTVNQLFSVSAPEFEKVLLKGEIIWPTTINSSGLSPPS